MTHRKPDPVDLMLMGRMKEATDKYLGIYMEVLEIGDRYIGPDLVAQMHFSVAGQNPGTDPESVTDEVESLVRRAAKERGIIVDEQFLADDFAIAKKSLEVGRKRSERSILALDSR